MGDWPVSNQDSFVTPLGINTGTSTGVTVSSSGSANTKGSWAVISSATPFEARGLVVNVGWTTGSEGMLLDIGTGGIGAEVAVINNLLIGSNPGNSNTRGQRGSYFFPISLPKGVRLAGCIQASSGSKDAEVGVYLISGGYGGPSTYNQVHSFGALTASSLGTDVDPGGAANTKGSWVQFSAACTNTIRGLVIAIGSLAGSYGRVLLDVGIGGAGSEAVIISNWMVYHNYDSQCKTPAVSPFLPCLIPSGSRIAVRVQDDTVSDGSNRVVKVALYGVV